jgi:Putative MetA-pathway of phenol degradation
VTPRWVLAAWLAVLPHAAQAEDRDYCPDRPGLDTPACTIAPGKISIETSLADWTLDDQPDARTDTVLIGDTVARIGVSNAVEVRLGWTPFGTVRTRDKTTGTIDRAGRVGDVTLGVKANLHNPGGDGFSIALLPYVSLPVGRTPVGAGDWGAGLLVPVSYSLSDAVQLEATPELDAAVDTDGHGRHTAYGSALGVGWKVAEPVTLTGEIQAIRDDDPAGSTTQALAALSLAYSASDDLQFDIAGATGLNRDTPDVELIAGIARRF